ncbi:FecR domain-containing protein [Cyclobacterium sp. 1_MG-2023]|uniref:FecR family protein n=1 Tax=Cyclobacterium sp. 1_MG-2023 TaxID=3062681 RepID=UPI0026E42892|nr:FecR domain-containing protein [Cyclobacterium sp. 1_MG-2023]MDO6439613.1 FecR domain-containing protein [Cyclobacterium sp. 1_MG-2023]
MEDSLLIKYLLKETSKEESLAVKSWVGASEENEKYFNDFCWVWKKSKEIANADEFDVDEAWEQFKQNRDSKLLKSGPRGGQRFLSWPWIKIAASVVLLLGVFAIAFSFLPHSGKAYYASVDLASLEESKEEVLLDGSQLTLNKHTRLSYRQKFLGDDRFVTLMEGEAYFEVQKNPKKPFIIAVDEVEVRVLGTSFNIKKAEGKTIVIVDEGLVQVSTGKDELFLTKNEKATISTIDESIRKEPSRNQLFKYYVSKEFVAKDMALEELVEGLNEAYGSKIELVSERARSMSITTTLPFGPLEDNLEIIRQTLGVSISHEGGAIIIE